MIEINNLSFGYSRKSLLFRDLNLTLQEGHIYGLLGKNGAGKSTLLKNMVGLVAPTAGSCQVNGLDSYKRLPSMLADLYFIPEEIYMPSLTARQFVANTAPFYPLFDEEAFYRYLSEFEVPAHAVFSKMSFGQQKKAIIRNMADALKAFGYETPKLALLSLVEEVTFHMQDTVEAQRLVMEHARTPFADCQLWGPIAYDLILSKEAARLKNYDCDLCGGGFDGIIAPDLSTANTLVKSWLIHAHAITCGAVVGAKVPIALTSRSAAAEETELSLAFCAILDAHRKKQAKAGN